MCAFDIRKSPAPVRPILVACDVPSAGKCRRGNIASPVSAAATKNRNRCARGTDAARRRLVTGKNAAAATAVGRVTRSENDNDTLAPKTRVHEAPAAVVFSAGVDRLDPLWSRRVASKRFVRLFIRLVFRRELDVVRDRRRRRALSAEIREKSDKSYR